MTSPKLPPFSHLIYVVMQKRRDGRIYPDMHKPSSTGRVWADQGEFFPSVFGLHWKEGSYDN